MRTDRLRDDDADRSGGRPRQPVRGAPGPGLWRRCCLPYGDARYGVVVAGTKLGLRAGDYPFRGTPWQCTHAAADFRTDPDAVLARIFPDPWRRQPGLGADLGVVVPRCAGACRIRDDAFSRNALAPADPAHAAGHRGRFLLRLDAVAVPELAAKLLSERIPPGPE